MLLHIQSEVVPVHELDVGIPSSIGKIVQKCMQKKPVHRYLSASDLIVDLKHYILYPFDDFADELVSIKSSVKSPLTYLKRKR